jgi:hypothetical protein
MWRCSAETRHLAPKRLMSETTPYTVPGGAGHPCTRTLDKTRGDRQHRVAVLKGHLRATPAGQRAPRSFARGPPKTTNRPSWHPDANVGHSRVKFAGCGVTATHPVAAGLWGGAGPERVRRCGHGTAAAEGRVSSEATSEGTRGPGVPSPESDFDPHPLTRCGAGWPAKACFEKSMTRDGLLRRVETGRYVVREGSS